MAGQVTYTARLRLAKPPFDYTTWHDYVNGNFDKLDATLSTNAYFLVDAVWANNTSYVVGQKVYDDVAVSIWRCLIAHTSAASGLFVDDRTAHPTYWAQVTNGFALRGPWTTGAVYSVNDIATYGGSSYRALVDHIAGADFATDLAAGDWEIFAQKGDDGAPGPGSGDVNGPAASTAGNIPTFIDGTGKTLQDSGTALSSLAPIASPTFTGNPAAPTQTSTDNSTKLATTSFVQTVVNAINFVTNIAAAINGGTNTAFTDTDYLVARRDTTTLLKYSWANVKALLKSYFDSAYAPSLRVYTTYAGATVDFQFEYNTEGGSPTYLLGYVGSGVWHRYFTNNLSVNYATSAGSANAIPTGTGAVYTYAFLYYPGSAAVPAGSTVSGASLVYMNAGGTTDASTSPSGSWKLLGRLDNNPTVALRTSLWLRYA